MTGTEWLCLRLRAMIEKAADERATAEWYKLKTMPGSLPDKVYEQYLEQRKAAHRKRLLEQSEDVMEKVLREMSKGSEGI